MGMESHLVQPFLDPKRRPADLDGDGYGHGAVNESLPADSASHEFTPSMAPTTSSSALLARIGRFKKPMALVVSIAAGLVVRFAVPRPAEVSQQAWQLLSIFTTTIVGLILGPLPVGAWAFVCLTATVVTKTLSFEEAFGALTNDVIWLIVVAFFFSRGFVKSGLGDRVANHFIRWMGRRTLGLAYGLVLSEAVIAPAIPSSTARAGGLFSPVIASVAANGGSFPNHASAKKLGSFLAMTQMQCSGNTTNLFLTAAAQNLLCMKLAQEVGVNIASPWITWLKFACLPGFVSLALTPMIVYKLYPPGIKDTPNAPATASERLKQMGPVTRNEWIMMATMLLAVALWVAGDHIGISNVVAAMLALSVLLLLRVLDWSDCLSEKSAWDTLTWFAILVGMADQLTKLGLVSWMSNSVANGLKSMHVTSPAAAFAILQAAYFFAHYLFASQTAHVAALYPAFLGMNLASGVSGELAALALAYNTNLCGALTHYSSGQSAVHYGAGYLILHDVFKMGIIIAIINGAIWIAVGGCWWKLLGLY